MIRLIRLIRLIYIVETHHGLSNVEAMHRGLGIVAAMNRTVHLNCIFFRHGNWTFCIFFSDMAIGNSRPVFVFGIQRPQQQEMVMV